jgi:hypothetical protein
MSIRPSTLFVISSFDLIFNYIVFGASIIKPSSIFFAFEQGHLFLSISLFASSVRSSIFT